LSVQPLVENAIKHGISKVKWSGRVQVIAEDVESVLTIAVCDNGPGFDPHQSTSGLGMGLENVRQRLRLACPAGSDLKIDSSSSGCTVTVRVVQRPGGRSGRSQTLPVHAAGEPTRRL
jgi:sensor histidine kinase YesM